MEHPLPTDASAQLRSGANAPTRFPVSFVDRFAAAIERLPPPYWLTYFVLFGMEVLVLHILAWRDGWLALYRFDPVILVFPLWLWGPLAIITYLDSVALRALSAFATLLQASPEEIEHLKHEFTTMPPRPVVVNSLVWLMVYVVISYIAFPPYFAGNQIGPLGATVWILDGLITFLIGGTIYYHSIRQLRLVNRTVDSVPRFNLFRLDPVYAFSRLTARIGIVWLVLISLTLLLFPIELALIPVLLLLLSQVVLALAAFVLPLWDIHQRLLTEKRARLAGVNARIETMIERLHRWVDEGDLDGAGEVNKVLASLSTEVDILSRIPTWPWRAETLTGFLSALILPLVFILIQVALESWLGL